MEISELPPGKCKDILIKYFTNEFRSGYKYFRGCCLPEYYEKFANDIENFEVRDDDIFICSYPKSGTTWSSEMIWCVANNCDLETAKNKLLSERFPFLEISALFNYTNTQKRIPEFQVDESILNSVQYTANQNSHPRFIKTHLPFDLLPKQIRTGEKKPKIIYVARNPKDSVISYYHHSKLIEGYTGNFEDYCELFLAGTLMFCPYWKHLLDFWNRRNDKNILFYKYEEMKADLPRIIKKTASFLGVSLKENQIELLCSHLSIPSMRANNAVNYDSLIQMNKKYKLTQGEGQFIRSGTVNQWKDQMTPEMIKRFDEWTAENLKNSDLSFNL